MKKQKKSSGKVSTSNEHLQEVRNSATLTRTLTIICCVFAFALYANTLMHQFTVDDDLVISKNEFTKEGISAIPKIFATAYRAGSYPPDESLYRPLSVAMFAVEYGVAGDTPFFFHLMNVLLYALTGGILFTTLRMIFVQGTPSERGKNIWLPFLITLLFIAHPVHTEVVANVKSGDEVLAFLFSMLALYCVMKFLSARTPLEKNGKLFSVFGAAVCYFLALLGKETAVTMLLIIPLTLYFFAQPNRKQWMIVSVALASAFVVYMTIRIAVLHGATNFTAIDIINNSLAPVKDNFMKRTATAVYMLGKYILLLFIPAPLCYDYSYNTIPVVAFSDAGALLSLFCIIILAVMAVRGLRKKNVVAYGILFFGITISIVSNILFLIEATMAERFLYMPSLGFCIAVVFFLSKIFRMEPSAAYSGISDILKKNKTAGLFFVVVILLFSVKTVSRNPDWKNNFTLLQRDVKTHPKSEAIRYSLGSTFIFEKYLNEKDSLKRKEYLREGIAQLDTALTILPEDGDAWFSMAFGYNFLNDYKKAIPCFEKGFKHTTKAEERHYVGAGIAYGEAGDYRKSFAMLHHVLTENDTSYEALNNLGMFMSRSGGYDSSIYFLQHAIAVKPADAMPYYNLGNTYAYEKNFTTAIEWYRKALQFDLQMASAYTNMGNCYAALHEYRSALDAFQKAIQADASSQEAAYNLGVTYLILGDTVNAEKYISLSK
ncbi:MAG TPA: tetratricopeptide repeat protein [Chitinophagales bacterium]|nr:tetratricopeptide repeat protein [Chitinophagales bacterium]